MPEEHVPRALSDILQQKLQSSGHLSSDHDRNKFQHLLSGTQRGLEGLAYIRGNKKKEVSTMYDESPLGAVPRDFLNKAPVLGAGMAGLGFANNFYKDRGGRMHMNQALDRMTGNTSGEAAKGVRPLKSVMHQGNDSSAAGKEFSSLLGQMRTNNYLSPAEQDAHAKLFTILENKKHKIGDDPKRIARMIHEISPKLLGKKMTFEIGQSSAGDPISHALKGLYEDEDKVDAIKSHLAHLNNPRVSNYVGRGFDTKIPFSQNTFRDKMPEVADKVTNFFADKGPSPNKMNFSLGKKIPKFLSQANTSMGRKGLGLAAGGIALAPLLKMIQNKYYGDDKMNEWTSAARQVKGKFD